MDKNTFYTFTVRKLSKDEGGGFLVEYPDIPGCMSDGETIEEAIANGRAALRDTLAVFAETGHRIPKPAAQTPAQWRQRVPRSLYRKLTAQAETEGVSINSLVTAMIAESIGSKGRFSPSRAVATFPGFRAAAGPRAVPKGARTRRPPIKRNAP